MAQVTHRDRLIKKILVVRLGHMGDVILVTPCIRALRKHFPEAEIHFLVREQYEAIIRYNPHLTRMISVPKFEKNRIATYRDYFSQIGATDFDLAIDLHDTAASSLWVYASGAKIKAGLASFPRVGWDSVTHWNPNEHFIETFAQVLKNLQIPVYNLWPEIFLDPSGEIQNRVSQKLRSNGVEAKKFIILNPFSTYPSKCWPLPSYAQWIRDAQEKFKLPMIIMGAPNERQASEALLRQTPTTNLLNLTGELTLDEALVLYSMALLMVTGDSGPMHAADALGTQVISLFGPTQARRTGPWQNRHLVVQPHEPPSQFEYFKTGSEVYMEKIQVESVLGLTEKLLENLQLPESRSRLAIILTTQELSESNLNFVRNQIAELRRQEGFPLIALGVLNPTSEWMSFISVVDQLTVVEGDPLLIQREALRNQVVRELPQTVRKLIFLDPSMSPETMDWGTRTESLLEKFDFMLPFSAVRNVISVHQYLGPFHDPDNRWDENIPTDSALAMTRELWERFNGLPYRDGITGRNSVRHFFQYEYKRDFSVPHCFKSKIYLADPEVKMIRMGFTPRKLNWITQPKRDSKMRSLYLWALENRCDLDEHIQLTSTGGLELSTAGKFLRSELELLRSSSDFDASRRDLSVQSIKTRDLAHFAKKYLKSIPSVDLKPISLNDACQRASKIAANDDEIGLILGFLGDRCIAYAQLERVEGHDCYAVHSGFVYHHCKPTGIVNLMVDYLSSGQIKSVICTDGTVSLRGFSKIFTKPELERSVVCRFEE